MIRIVDEPRVYLVGMTTRLREAIHNYFVDKDIPGYETDARVDSEYLVELAGRICYQSFGRPRPGGIAAYTNHIIESGHGSVLEHATFNLIITGVSRSFTHELVRHRVGMSYSQLSQRFVGEDSCAFICPEIIRFDGDLYSEWQLAMERVAILYGMFADKLYKNMSHAEFVERMGYETDDEREVREFLRDALSQDERTLLRKRAREAARSLLPNATETEIFVTANARSLRHFIELRSAKGADREMRTVAALVYDAVSAAAPHLFSDYRKEDTDDGLVAVVTDHVKV